LSNQEKTLLGIHEEVAETEIHVLKMRKHEKDFLARDDVKYVKKLHDELNELQKHIKDLLFFQNKTV